MLSSAIFKRGGPKKESGSVPVRPTDDPDVDSEHGHNDSDGEESVVSLQELRDILSAPRSGKELSAGIWHPDLCLVELVLVRKGTGQPSGFTYRKKHYLFIEEAVYLVDRGDLLLFVQVTDHQGGAPSQRLLSVQECYELMTATDPSGHLAGCSMDRFLVYCTLMRQGYLVMRHPSFWILEQTQDLSEACGEAWRPLGAQKEEVTAESSSRMDAEDENHGIRSEEKFPLAFPGASSRRRVGIKRELGAGHPPGISCSTHRGWWPKAGLDHPHFQVKEDASGGREGAGERVWEDCPTHPYLLAPGIDLRQSFPRLRPLPPFNHSRQGPTAPEEQVALRRVELAYDVYSPGATKQVARARRSFPSLSMHLVMCPDRPPTPSETHKAEEQARAHARATSKAEEGGEGGRDAAPVFWASVDTGIVSFFGLVGVDLIPLL